MCGRWATRLCLGPVRALLYFGGVALSRFGIFVDAGYVYAESSKLLFGTKKDRRQLVLDLRQFNAALVSFASE